MVRRLLNAGLLTLTAITAPALYGADAARGRELAETNCIACHDTGMYTRPDRKARDSAALTTQIRQGVAALALDWNDRDIADVAAYLNQTYYKFPP